LPSTLAGWIPFSLIIAGVTLRMRWGMLIGTVYAYVWLLLQIRQWWIPYLLGRTRLHDDFSWYHDHGYAETLKVPAPIGERPCKTHGLFRAGAREKAGASECARRVRDRCCADCREGLDETKLHVVSIAPLIANALAELLTAASCTGTAGMAERRRELRSRREEHVTCCKNCSSASWELLSQLRLKRGLRCTRSIAR
jgi:hypothetical protein